VDDERGSPEDIAVIEGSGMVLEPSTLLTGRRGGRGGLEGVLLSMAS